MEDFVRQIKENLENRPEPSFDERVWADLEQRIENRNEKKPLFIPWYWALLPFLALLALNGVFYLEIKGSNHKTQAILSQKDTVVQIKVIRQIDTVYLASAIHTRPGVGKWFTTPNLMPPGLFDLPGSRVIRTEPEGPKYGSVSLEEGTIVHDLAFDSSRHFSVSPVLVMAPQPLMPLKPEEISRRPPPREMKTIEKKQRKTIGEHLNVLAPVGFRAGVTGGWVYPFNIVMDRQSGFSVGVQTLTEFPQNLRLWVDAHYAKVHFESSKMDETIGIPVVNPPSDEYTFDQAEVLQPSLLFSIGIQYAFLKNSRLKPFAGFGYSAVSLLPYEVVYDFSNKNLGAEWSFDKEVENQGVTGHFYLLQAGLERNLAKNCYWQLWGYYRGNWEKPGIRTPGFLGMQGGLQVRF